MFDPDQRLAIVGFYLRSELVGYGPGQFDADTLRARNTFLGMLLMDAEVRDCLERICADKALFEVHENRYRLVVAPPSAQLRSALDPFVVDFNRVLSRNTSAIIERVPIQYWAAHENADTDADPGWRAFYHLIHIGSKQYTNLMRLVRPWHQLRAQADPESAEQFLKGFAELFRLKRTSPPEGSGLTLPAARFEVPIPGLAKQFSIMLYLAADEGQLRECSRHVTSVADTNQVAILYVPANAVLLEMLSIVGRKLIRLSENRLKPIAATSNPREALAEELLRQADLHLLSPYAWEGPAPPAMFYGRETELALLTSQHNTSFAIYGPRRIGKTSLALQLEEFLGSAKGNHQEYPVYIDYAVSAGSHDALHRLAQRFKLSWRRGGSAADFVSSVRKALARKPPGSRLMPILDEIDRVIMSQADHEDFFWALRVLINERLARVIVCGFLELRRVSAVLSHPAFNMFRPLHLRNLEMPPAKALVSKPLNALGVSFSPSEMSIVNNLINKTGTHPGTIQFFCDQLLEVLNRKRDHVITNDDIDAVYASNAFAKYVLAGLDGLEEAAHKLLSVHTVVSETPMATIVQNCKDVLTKGEVQAAVKCLADLMILDETALGSDTYVYAQPAVPRIVRLRHGQIDV